MAVKSVVMALRHSLTQQPRSWYPALPLAFWGPNDLPGLVAPYSPHRLVLGREPVGFGEVPPQCREMARRMRSNFFQDL